MTQSPANFAAVLFDCDGVLVDSEHITQAVLRDLLEEAGWSMTLEECMGHFVGKMVRQQRALIEERTGQVLTDAWMAHFYHRRNLRLRAELQPVPGALATVQAAYVHTHGQIACASGADRYKVEFQIAMVGMEAYFSGRIFSGHEMPQGKPAPDVYLAAAAHLKVDPRRALVIEDTPTGVLAGAAAGAEVWAYAPDATRWDALLEAGASRCFSDMAAIARCLRTPGLAD